MAQEEEDRSSLEDQFAAAVRVIRSLPEDGPFQPSDDMMLMFYSYYQQATLGPCNFPRPSGFWDSRGKAKWDAWRSLGSMTKEEAMMNYVDDIQLILETIPICDEVSDLVEKLGTFYSGVEAGLGGEEDEQNEVDKRAFTRPFAQHAEWRSTTPRQRRVVQGRRWGCDPRGSSSTSRSSVTNGTHSSLNSQLEEEELACSVEPTLYSHLNGHLSDHSDGVPEKNCRATDSDNEEFCDSMEHLAIEEGLGTSKVQSSGSRAVSVRGEELWVQSQVTLNGVEDQMQRGEAHLEEGLTTVQHTSCLSGRGRGSQSSRAVCGSQLCAVSQVAKGPIHLHQQVAMETINIHQQIAMALLRLQDDMSNVLHRLHTLEVLAVTQSRSPSPRQEDSLPLARKFQKAFWWPFHLSPVTVAMTTVWPLIAHWLVHLYLQWKRRRIS